MREIIEVPNVFEVAKDYVNTWVVLSEDYKKVIASGETLDEVLKKTSSQKRKAVFPVPASLPYFPYLVSVGR